MGVIVVLRLLSCEHHVLNVALVRDQLVLGVVPKGVLAVLADDVEG